MYVLIEVFLCVGISLLMHVRSSLFCLSYCMCWCVSLCSELSMSLLM